jgi:hypothetical protein
VTDTLSEALRWRDLGIAPIPLFRRDKRPCLSTWQVYQQQLPTEIELRGWFDHRFRNLAIITGWQGLTVIDFDDAAAYDLWRIWAINNSGMAAMIAEMTYQVRTSRGMHVYVALDNPPPGTMKLGKVDVKANGYVLTYPSIHPSGHVYTPVDPTAPILRTADLSDVLPPELLDLHVPEPEPATIPVQRVEVLPDDPWQCAVTPVRVADSPLDDIRNQHNILELFPGAIRKGSKLWARCILHQDSDPSVEIATDRNRAKCWAGCTGRHWWDYTDWYAALNRLSLSQAIQLLGA